LPPRINGATWRPVRPSGRFCMGKGLRNEEL
jgi:hypothetical protein